MRDCDVKVISKTKLKDVETLIGDVDRIQQVLLNLSSNARKFVPRQHGCI